MQISALQKNRSLYQPKIPTIFQKNLKDLNIQNTNSETLENNAKRMKEIFPNTYNASSLHFVANTIANADAQNKQSNTQTLPDSIVHIGIILSGGPAPGGHNVIAGLFDSMNILFSKSYLYGFMGGPQGAINGNFKEITLEIVNQYRNTGGFDMLYSGRTKLEGIETFEKVAENCKNLNLNALVIVGGDDSNTNTALLSEYFLSCNIKTRVIGCPKTIDGDLKNAMIETSFGFDTACRTYSEIICNIAKDACSVRKYWHFIRLMGRTASHITLECALQTQPNITIISEEVAQNKLSLEQIVNHIVSVIILRSKEKKNFGIVLLPEGLIEFIPEIQMLIIEINTLLGIKEREFSQIQDINEKVNWVMLNLSSLAQNVYNYLPQNIREQIIDDRDPHGNVQVSVIETEKLLISLIKDKLKIATLKGEYKDSFRSYGHFLGYEGRCAFPTNFDADYCYTLGYTACLLITHGYTGYMSCVQNLHLSTENWQPGGIPITTMMNIEERKGQPKPVITKTLVNLNGNPFKKLLKERDTWAKEDYFSFPGAIQYYGPHNISDQVPITLQLEKGL